MKRSLKYRGLQFVVWALFTILLVPFARGQSATAEGQYLSSAKKKPMGQAYYSVSKYSNRIAELQRTISVEAHKTPIRDILEDIVNQADLGLAYNAGLLSLKEPITIQLDKVPVGKALEQVLEETAFEANISQMREIVLKRRPHPELRVVQLQQNIAGTVSDAQTGDPLPGVNVFVTSDPTTGTSTDSDGTYSLTVADEVDSLSFTFIGYEGQQVAINSQTTINVALEPQVQAFGEMVVTAFGVEQEEKELGYSVEQVSSEELTAGQSENVVSALQAKVSGVQVTNTGGAPGSSSRILIRGISSLDPDADNQPLFVVDGVPIDNSTIQSQDTPRGLSNRAADLNPDDIESVSVLKGAAASALYGVRAANGAVIITTKKGQAGDVQINFNNSIGFDRVNSYPSFQKVYGQGFGGEATTDSFWPNWGAPIAEVADTLEGWQYYDIWGNSMETGVKINNSISVSGGSDIATYYGSVSNLSHDGVIPFSDWGRTSVRFSGNIKPGDDLQISSSVNFVNSGGNRVPADRFMERLMYWAPTKDVTDYEKSDGTMRGYYGNESSGTNPIYDAKYSTYEDDVNRVIGNVNVNYNLAEWMSASYRFGMDYYSDQRTNITPGPLGIENENVLSSTGFIRERRINSRDFNSTLNLTFNREITEELSAEFTLGNDVFDRERNIVTAEGNDFVTPRFYNLSNTREISTGQDKYQRRLIGIYGDLTLNYNDYLFVNTTGRNDWSSTLPIDNRSFFYPSVSTGFVFSEIMELPEFFSYGKIRASYAQVGKDADPYSTGITFNSPDTYPLNGQVGYTRTQTIGSADLKPEITTSIELGTDLRFWNGRAGIDFTYYKANSADQILTVPISNAVGGTRLITNAGEIENRGIEMQLNVTPIESDDFQWDVRVNYSRNRNEVISIREGIESIFLGSSFGYGGSRASIRLVEGEPFGNIYGTSYARYYPDGEPEDQLYVDEDRTVLIGEDGFPVVDNDQKVLGNAFPDWIGGIYNGFSYKNVDFSFLIDIQQGMDVYSQYDNFFAAFGITENTLDRNEYRVFNGVTADGQPNTQEVWLGQGADPEGRIDPETGEVRDYGAGFYRNTYRTSTENFVKDASFIKLRNINLSYSLPANWIQRIPFERITASATASNIILYTPFKGFDPESRSGPAGTNATGFTGLDHPGVSSFVFSLNFSL
ncbi:SusC/RagA family TonB-linked outer membrane protein [Fodinibius salsisoli]|uniref:SusC/RagA family TonB-linked outer membrane protein n=1 Tax=Fodinibius salsisoli TaxID=2820877 RepID=A0ABT3PRQ9_9BACT|nr:SusC/RagA family TonB-linked outer membrane protein [Fodinibius salsisoli]MCW9708549.1 SusC/RagA family TonB-linked outer membrane protein [Fodinibius salsisoli]